MIAIPWKSYSFYNKNQNSLEVTLQKWDNWNSSYSSLIVNNVMNNPIPNLTSPVLNNINFIVIPSEDEVLKAVNNGTADITLQYRSEYSNFKTLFYEITNPVVPIVEKGIGPQMIFYNIKSPIWGMNPSKPCEMYTDVSCITTSNIIIDTTTSPKITPPSTNTSNFDSLPFFVACVTITLVILYKRYKKQV